MLIPAWYYKRVFAELAAHLALSDNSNCALYVWYYLTGYTESTIGIVWRCQLCKSLITLCHKVLDNANCADNAFYGGVLRCHLCRQCQLCAWDTVFLKLNFHPVNFHFMHIWHCLWHFLGLKYAHINRNTYGLMKKLRMASSSRNVGVPTPWKARLLARSGMACAAEYYERTNR